MVTIRRAWPEINDLSCELQNGSGDTAGLVRAKGQSYCMTAMADPVIRPAIPESGTTRSTVLLGVAIKCRPVR